jgi:tetratricopeptide (TPR) repeat protein
LEALREYDALRLFAERAASARPGFTVTEENGAQVAQVCQKLDGIPLAIELAASRAGMLGIAQIAERLGKSLDLLRQNRNADLPRHQTMRLCLDWSHRMLSNGEQTLLRRLAVFAGGFTLAGAESVCGFGEITAYGVLDLLDGLVNRSLVVVEGQAGEETRFRLLEPVKQYGEEKLAEAAEAEMLKDRHLDYCLELAIEGEPYLRGREQGVWLKRLMGEIHNFRAALGWALDRNVYSGLHLVLVLGRVWFLNNMLLEGSRWVRLLVAQEEATAKTERTPDQQWLHLCGLFVISQSRPAIEMLSGELEKRVSQRVYDSVTLDWMYWKNVQFYEDYEEVARIQFARDVYVETVLDQFRTLAPTLGIQGKRILRVYLNNLIANPFGSTIRKLEDVGIRLAQGKKLFDLALEISQQGGTVFDLSEVWGTAIGMLDTSLNFFEEAVSIYQTALRLKEQAGDLHGIAYIKDRQAAALAGSGDFKCASQQLDEALLMFSQIGGYLLWKMTLITKGTVTWCLGDAAGAEKLYRLAQEYSRDKDVDHYLAGYYLGCLAYLHGDFTQAEQHLKGLESHYRQFEEKIDFANFFLGLTFFGLGEMALLQGEVERAKLYLEDALAHHLRCMNPRLIAAIYFSLGKVAIRQGQLDTARMHYREALPYWGAPLDNPGLVYTLQALAELEAARGQYKTAAHLLGCASALRPRLRNPFIFFYIIRLSLEPVDTMTVEASSRQALGEAAYLAAYAEGHALSVDQAYILAQEVGTG